MVHTHQSRGLRLQLGSCCVTDCITQEVLSVETRNQPDPAPKRYQYRSFDEAMKIPLFRSAFNTVVKLYRTLQSFSLFFFSFPWFWITVIVYLAKLADSIFRVRLLLILVDSTIFRVLVALRQRYPVLGVERNELIIGFKDALRCCQEVVYSTGTLVILKFRATWKLRTTLFLRFGTLCNRLTTYLDKFENLVDHYFPIDPVYSRPSSSGCSSSGGDYRSQEVPVDGGLDNID